ncbi:YfgM family protein [Pseudoalteromonas tunicata]|jgi:predicted negative regulator of RcsB-dependent stress response|uniref:Ancillary SecYEG translocon subunit n=1 Tax=Pseudoalteromonas tunicata D2 TaxID=87626 RepID=A4C7F4_9GAMM|nr:tetratricopeptide repeat protein [Pseudoalteromonas tunicata]ATC95878.1 hypothetical protein PTUN_a3570 [Pseudoalteromonas tunicata]AXT31422.1 hypothetical protein D1819_11725 [Pseudoalteromonas tunicata]EAR29908.1 putative membrane-associated protein with TPR-like domain [Pseudoalteromonas tunicata D2]MDP4984836.1 tetratricopeptide repeat protein [Pseudoalteromonas tunicata]
MEIYSTEEQQAEAIKRFFRENGTALVIGVVLGLGGLYGWKAYNQNQVESAEAASDAYEKLVKADAQNKTNALAGADEFIKNNKDSSYAVLAAFVAAKEAVEKADFNLAKEKLTWITQNNKNPELNAIANSRIARIELELKNYDAALKVLSVTMPEAFKASVAELKGDVYRAQGDLGQARSAYQAAADAGGLTNNATLQMKLDDLAVDTPAL